MGSGASTSRDVTTHTIVVARNDRGVLGIGLNDSNMVTVPGPAGTLAGLRVWDKVLKIDGVACGSKTLVATMTAITPKPSHTLTVLRNKELASHPVPSAPGKAALGWRLVPSEPVPTGTRETANEAAASPAAALAEALASAPAEAPASGPASAEAPSAGAAGAAPDQSVKVAAMKLLSGLKSDRPSRTSVNNSLVAAFNSSRVARGPTPNQSPRTVLNDGLPALAPLAPLPPIVSAA